MGTSPSTLQRIRKDINMKSPYRYDIQTNRKPSNTATTTTNNKEVSIKTQKIKPLQSKVKDVKY